MRVQVAQLPPMTISYETWIYTYKDGEGKIRTGTIQATGQLEARIKYNMIKLPKDCKKLGFSRQVKSDK